MGYRYPGFTAFAVAFHLLAISVQSDLIGDVLSPIFSPAFGDVCRNVQCGRGRCKASSNSTFAYECECDSGWLQSPVSNSIFLQFDLKFLPCTFPNCTMNAACGTGPPPIGAKTNRPNDSFFDPCLWVDCGGGICNKTSSLTHNCTCFEGYYNLFNVSTFPCYQRCEIELGCFDLGIDLKNHSAPPPPLRSLNQIRGENQAAATLIQGNSHWTLGLTPLLFYAMFM